jgi:hypothetical protein
MINIIIISEDAMQIFGANKNEWSEIVDRSTIIQCHTSPLYKVIYYLNLFSLRQYENHDDDHNH